MSERSYRSNPRKTVVAQSLGSVAPSDSVKKSGQYSYSSRKGRSSSQSSLTRDKTDPEKIADSSADQDSLRKEGFDSRERLSDRNRERDRRRTDRYSDDDSDYDRDRRRRMSSRERDRRRTDRYSDEDSDYDRDRRRRRRSYDSYSDDSDYERGRDRRKSRERYNNESFENEDESDRGAGRERERDKQSNRKGSRDRKRDRHSYDKYDDDDTDQGTDFEQDRDRYRRHSRDRDRKRNRDSYDEDKAYRKHHEDDDDYIESRRRRRSAEKRRGLSAERDRLSVDLEKRSRSREILTAVDRDRQSPPLPMPPPYTEEDPRQNPQQPALTDIQNPNTKELPLPLPPADLMRATEDVSTHALNSTHRNKRPTGHKSTPAADRPSQQYPSTDPAKHPEQQNAHVQYRHRQAAKPPPSGVELRQHDKPPPKEFSEADRRKSNDDRRERYSNSRWTPKTKRPDSPPPEYEDVAPKSTFVGISYREESV